MWTETGSLGELAFPVMVVTIASGVSLLCTVLLWRTQKVSRDTAACFDRIASVGFRSDPQLRSLDKSIALSVPPLPPAAAATPGAAGAVLPRKKPFEKGLVLIGGFGDMPHMWEGLAERASKAGWYTLAPRTPGWGRTDFREANKVCWTDWVLACRDSLAVARGLCDEVTVVAHSTGAPVAALVAETQPIDRLILTGPNFLSQAGDRWAKKLLLRPVVGPLVTKYLGAVVKKRRRGRPVDSLNVASYETAFYLTCLPVHTLRQMWILQDKLSRPWRVSGEVLMLMGESDESVAPLLEQADFVRGYVPEDVSFRACSIPNAAHGLPTETEGVVDTLAKIVVGGDEDLIDKLALLAEAKAAAAAGDPAIASSATKDGGPGNGNGDAH
ncbi:unnamed protein product [Ectocarpus sp. 12 AP-2014]